MAQKVVSTQETFISNLLMKTLVQLENWGEYTEKEPFGTFRVKTVTLWPHGVVNYGVSSILVENPSIGSLLCTHGLSCANPSHW